MNEAFGVDRAVGAVEPIAVEVELDSAAVRAETSAAAAYAKCDRLNSAAVPAGAA